MPSLFSSLNSLSIADFYSLDSLDLIACSYDLGSLGNETEVILATAASWTDCTKRSQESLASFYRSKSISSVSGLEVVF